MAEFLCSSDCGILMGDCWGLQDCWKQLEGVSNAFRSCAGDPNAVALVVVKGRTNVPAIDAMGLTEVDNVQGVPPTEGEGETMETP